jgi:hypothetical protein
MVNGSLIDDLDRHIVNLPGERYVPNVGEVIKRYLLAVAWGKNWGVRRQMLVLRFLVKYHPLSDPTSLDLC